MTEHCCQRWFLSMKTSSNGNIFRITGHLGVTSEFPAQRPVLWSFDVFFDLHLNKRLCKHLWGWWFETPSCPLWCHCNVWCFAAPTSWHVRFTIRKLEYHVVWLHSDGPMCETIWKNIFYIWFSQWSLCSPIYWQLKPSLKLLDCGRKIQIDVHINTYYCKPQFISWQ